MNGLPVLIGFGGFKVYRFVTEGAHCKFGLGNRVENVLACEAACLVLDRNAFRVPNAWPGLLPSDYRTPSTRNKSDNSRENE
jgi:hypothetical protein